MGCIPAEPRTFFSVGPAEQDKAQCFAVRRGSIQDSSLGAGLYTPELQQYLKRLGGTPEATRPLSAYADVNPTSDYSGLNTDASVSFIPMEAVSDGATGEYTLMDRPLSEVRKGYTPFISGDILWAKITPCMQNGKSCIVDNLTNGVGFGSTEFHVLRVRDPRISNRFVFEFVSQDALRRLATCAFTGSAGQQRVPGTFLQDLPFPELSETRQIELVEEMDKARAKRKAKLAEADALLAGLDEFLLEALDVVLPQDDLRRVFAVRLGQPRLQGQLNPDYYNPERVLTLRSLANSADGLVVTSLSEIVSFVREQVGSPTSNYLSLAHVESHTGELSDSTETASGTCFTYRADDVLFARLRPYLNKVYLAETSGCCSTEFHVLRVKSNDLLPGYIAAVLRSRLILAQTVHMMTRNTHPRLTNDHVANLKIPTPKVEIQEMVVAEVRRRRDHARRLRVDAESGWQAAKSWFEEQLLGSPAS